MSDNPRRAHRRSYNEPGHAHELTFSCYHGYNFLEPDRTCQWLCDAIDRARQEYHFHVWAYVFMPNHVHAILWPRQKTYDVAAILRAIKQPVSRKAIAYLRKHAPEWIQRITVAKGTETRRQFWQKGGGYDRNITEPRTLISMIDYLHLNPVRRGLVERGRNWKWSSAAWFDRTGESPLRVDPLPPEWLAE